MAVISGVSCNVYVSGVPVALSSEACSLESGKTYRVTDSAKRVLDPDTVPVIKDNGVVVAATSYTLDYLFGRVRRNTGSWTTPVIVFSGNYLPLHKVATAKDVSLDVSCDLLDVSRLGEAFRRRCAAGRDVSFSLSDWDNSMFAYDGVSAAVYFADMIRAAGTYEAEHVMEFVLGSYSFRARCLLSADNVTAGQNDAVNSKVEGKMSAGVTGTDLSFSDSTEGGFGS